MLINFRGKVLRINNFRFSSSSSAVRKRNTKQNDEIKLLTNDENNFPLLKILPFGNVRREQRILIKSEVISPRYKRLKENCNWTNVWPTARNFHPATIPLPIHMSYVDDNKISAPVGKFNNPELLKIPNFFHLTPITVKRQCEAIKRFCTRWPKALKTDDDCQRHFPITIRTKDFVFSGPSIRWPDSRIVELSFKLSGLKLDEHSHDKMKRLLAHRYNPETDIATIRTDSCPLRKQNYDYAHYLLTASYFESWKIEKWETEKEYSDWEKYFWNQSKSRESLLNYLKKCQPKISIEQLEQQSNVKQYADAVIKLYGDNDGIEKSETNESLNQYKQSVLKILFA
ncbi:mitochondrial ribosomal protein S35 [Dermatophagoides pteronyssinus]|uniref:mitochondrial ribosomal protein S35 n=1 Tax=Dermatophagoides pteronyssinus TaxID=6956 RepID=UPI003F66C41B